MKNRIATGIASAALLPVPFLLQWWMFAVGVHMDIILILMFTIGIGWMFFCAASLGIAVTGWTPEDETQGVRTPLDPEIERMTNEVIRVQNDRAEEADRQYAQRMTDYRIAVAKYRLERMMNPDLPGIIERSGDE